MFVYTKHNKRFSGSLSFESQSLMLGDKIENIVISSMGDLYKVVNNKNQT